MDSVLLSVNTCNAVAIPVACLTGDSSKNPEIPYIIYIANSDNYIVVTILSLLFINIIIFF